MITNISLSIILCCIVIASHYDLKHKNYSYKHGSDGKHTIGKRTLLTLQWTSIIAIIAIWVIYGITITNLI